MRTHIERLFTDLEQVLADVVLVGFRNVQPAILNRLEEIRQLAAVLCMQEAVGRIEAFTAALRSYRQGEGSLQEAAAAWGALECYEKQVLLELRAEDERYR